MGIGLGVFLLVAGAILTFAVNTSVSSVDLDVVGWILMAAGALCLAITLAVFMPRTRRARSVQTSVDPYGRPTTVDRRDVVSGT